MTRPRRAPPKMTEAERKRRPCAACGKPVGVATIVCGGRYPDAPLCMACGGNGGIGGGSMDTLYAMIESRAAMEPR